MNIVPFPGSDSTRMVPPLRFTNTSTIDNPSPVPASSFVVKKGSKRCAFTSGVVPTPLVAHELLLRFGKEHDDALVMVARA